MPTMIYRGFLVDLMIMVGLSIMQVYLVVNKLRNNMPLSVKVSIGILVGALTAMIARNPVDTLALLAILGVAVATIRVLVFIVEDI